MNVKVIFDIGKTNKKCFLFDENYREVYQEVTQFKELEDEDGFPCDDLMGITNWINSTFKKVLHDPKYQVEVVNFSGYGASFVHLDENGQPIAPLYNYLKPFPKKLLSEFHRKYGDPLTFATQTASPPLGMLNSGLQLYWLKYIKPKLFKKIKWSLHLPQYLSYIISEWPVSECTSIGCHTGLWDFERQDYHDWVYAENIDKILPPITSSSNYLHKTVNHHSYKVGVGIHDSSAALLPYKSWSQIPFLVLSTGTWNITINPFNQQPLTQEELTQDCLNFLGIDQKIVRASRLFLGHEHQYWVQQLTTFYKVAPDTHTKIQPNPEILNDLGHFPKSTYRWKDLNTSYLIDIQNNLHQFPDFEVAYHKLMQELFELQKKSLLLAKGNTEIKKIFVDGGFANNPLFMYFLNTSFPNMTIINSSNPIGSALGAALVLAPKNFSRNQLEPYFR